MPKHTEPSLRDGFRVHAAENGGWIVTIPDPRRDGMMADAHAALSNDEDLIRFLMSELGVQIPVGVV